jgi:hypothetical protein
MMSPVIEISFVARRMSSIFCRYSSEYSLFALPGGYDCCRLGGQVYPLAEVRVIIDDFDHSRRSPSDKRS